MLASAVKWVRAVRMLCPYLSRRLRPYLSQMLRPYPGCCTLIPNVHADAELHFRNSALHLRFKSMDMVYMNAFELSVNQCFVHEDTCCGMHGPMHVVLQCDVDTNAPTNQRHLSIS